MATREMKVKLLIEPERKKKRWKRGPSDPRNLVHPPGVVPKGCVPYKPGKSGNPLGSYGKTKTQSVTKLIGKAYRMRLGDICELPGCEGLTWAEAIAKGIIEVAAHGDVSAAREVRETTEGKTPDKVMVGGLEDAPPIRQEIGELDARISELIGSPGMEQIKPRGEGGADSSVGKKAKASKKS